MLTRRELLRVLGAGAGLELFSGLTPEGVLAFGRRIHAQTVSTARTDAHAHQGETIAMAAERILPASETPGATDAGVGPFIERILADWMSPVERDRMVAGLAALDARSRERHGRAFIECAEAQQTALLASFDDEVSALRAARRGGEADNHWFAQFKRLVVTGYMTSEVVARDVLRTHPFPGRYDACAPYVPVVPLRRSP